MRPGDAMWTHTFNDLSAYDGAFWFCLNPLIPETPMDYRKWQEKDPGSGLPPAPEKGKGAWHKVLDCPSCPSSENVMGNTGYQANTGMSYFKQYHEEGKTALAGGDIWSWGIASDWHRVSAIKYPTLHVNYVDGTAKGSFGFRPFTHGSQIQLTAGLPYYFRHGNQLNASFTDGHVEAIPMSKTLSNDPRGGTYFERDFYWYPGSQRNGGDNR